MLSTSIEPELGLFKPIIRSTNVVLPRTESPEIPIKSPRLILKLKLLKILSLPHN